jgi:membrane fusion protein (multidrug efflux system)
MQKEKTDQEDVAFILADGSSHDHRGKLVSASGNIDRTTGSMSMKAIFPNPDKLLRSGGSGRIVLRTTVDSTVLVPMASVKDIQDKFFVFKLGDSSRVEMHPIEIAGRSGNDYLIKSGVTAGDKIAINRIDALMDGLEVIPTTVANHRQ